MDKIEVIYIGNRKGIVTNNDEVVFTFNCKNLSDYNDICYFLSSRIENVECKLIP